VNKSNFEEIISLDIAALIAYINENDQKSHGAFSTISDSNRGEFIFGIISDATLARICIAELPFIIIYNPLDRVNALFDDTFDVDRIE
jgi:hypothetical protein